AVAALILAAAASFRQDRYQAAYQEGIEQWMRGAPQEALGRFEAAAAAEPGRPEPWLMRGRCLLRLQGPAAAEAAWSEALARDPQFGPALLERGKAAVAAYVRLRPAPEARETGGKIQ